MISSKYKNKNAKLFQQTNPELPQHTILPALFSTNEQMKFVENMKEYHHSNLRTCHLRNVLKMFQKSDIWAAETIFSQSQLSYLLHKASA